jgi:urea transporter
MFRGIGQLTFVESTNGGLALTAMLAYFAPFTCACVLAGSFLSVFWAHVIGADKFQIRSGLIAFNGILVTAGAPIFISPPAAVIAIAVFGSLMATIIHDQACKRLSFPLLTLPFVITEIGALCLTKIVGLGPVANFPFYTKMPSFDHVGELFASADVVTQKLLPAVPLSITQLCFTTGPTLTFGALFVGLIAALDRRVVQGALIGSTVGCSFGLLYGMPLYSSFYYFIIILLFHHSF